MRRGSFYISSLPCTQHRLLGSVFFFFFFPFTSPRSVVLNTACRFRFPLGLGRACWDPTVGESDVIGVRWGRSGGGFSVSAGVSNAQPGQARLGCKGWPAVWPSGCALELHSKGGFESEAEQFPHWGLSLDPFRVFEQARNWLEIPASGGNRCVLMHSHRTAQCWSPVLC